MDEKNDIVADGEFAPFKYCRWQGGLAAHPWPPRRKKKTWLVESWNDVSEYFLRKKCRIFPDGESVSLIWLDENYSFPKGEAEELSRQSRRVVTPSRRLLLGGFPRKSDGSPREALPKKWRRQVRLDRTMDAMIKADGIADPVYSFCLAQLQAQKAHNQIWPIRPVCPVWSLLRIRHNRVLDEQKVVIDYHIS